MSLRNYSRIEYVPLYDILRQSIINTENQLMVLYDYIYQECIYNDISKFCMDLNFPVSVNSCITPHSSSDRNVCPVYWQNNLNMSNQYHFKMIIKEVTATYQRYRYYSRLGQNNTDHFVSLGLRRSSSPMFMSHFFSHVIYFKL